MLKLTMYKGETLLIENHDGSKITLDFIRTTKACVKIDVTAPKHYLIHRLNKRKKKDD